MRWILVLTFLLTACAHETTVGTPPAGGGLFPYGAYQHKVKIIVQQPEKRQMEMRGAVAYSADQLKVVGLSSFGTTVFRIEENLKTGEIRKEFYLEVVEKHEDRFMEFYSLIKELLTAPKGATEFDKRGAHFSVTEPDKLGIYRKVHIVHPQVIVDIAVTGYAF